ncbi:MAG TPA: NADH-quinone oxidoreductase subunit NuoK [Candidatus Obscuribacterales bacterium]
MANPAMEGLQQLGDVSQQMASAPPAADFGQQLLTIGVQHYLIAAAVLFCIGLYGVTTSRNLIKVLMSIELLLNAVNLNFVAFSKYVTPENLSGQVVAIFILTIAAAEAGVGLAIALAIYKHFKTVDIDKIHLMKW